MDADEGGIHRLVADPGCIGTASLSLPAEALAGAPFLAKGALLEVQRDGRLKWAPPRDSGTGEVVAGWEWVADTPDVAADLPLLASAGRLVRRGLVKATAQVTGLRPGAVDLRLDVSLAESVYRGQRSWLRLSQERLPTAADLFSALQPWGCADPPRAAAMPAGSAADAAAFTLPQVFRGLPKQVTSPPAPRGPAPPPLHLLTLPDEALVRIVGFLDRGSVRQAAESCRMLRWLAADAAPGLRLTLKQHQRAAVRWMAAREAEPVALPHPAFERRVTERGVPFWVDPVSGALLLEEPPGVHDFRGGLFCDEPGLGKTVTALALILSTAGRPAAAPPGRAVSELEGSGGGGRRAIRYYTLPEEAASSGARLRAGQASRPGRPVAGGRSTRSRHAEGSAPLMELGLTGRPEEVAVPSGAGGVWEEGGESDGDARAGPGSGKRPRLDAFAPSGSLAPPTPPTAEPPAASASGGSGVPGEGGPAPDPWCLQCDSCKRWRLMPAGFEPTQGDWFCSMHPEEGWRSCGVAQDPAISTLSCFSKASGFIGEGEVPGAPSNVDFFRGVLSKHAKRWSRERYPYRLQDRLNALHWIATQAPEVFVEGSRVDAQYRHPEWFGEVLLDVGLERAPSKKKFRHVQKAQGSGYSSVWRQPSNHCSLLLDTEALWAALKAGPKDDPPRVYLSSATLVIVPAELIQHWQDQARWHTQPGALRVAVVDSTAELSDVELAQGYDLVITSFPFLSGVWNSGQPLSNVLMRVHWLRVILDEGHTLGGSSVTSKLQMATALHAERRWLITGTPAPRTRLAALQPLLAFLHEEPFGARLGLKWKEAVEAPFAARHPAALRRLHALLSRCMIRASKEDLVGLPPLQRLPPTLLEFSTSHASSYHLFVDLVKFNLMTSDWYDPGHTESLLSEGKSNKERASQTAYNLRLSCNIAGNCALQVGDEDIHALLELLVKNLNDTQGRDLPMPKPLASGRPFLQIDHPLAHIERGLACGGPEHICCRCGKEARVLVVTPCAHLLCMDCTGRSRTACTAPGCGVHYVMQSRDDLKRKQYNHSPQADVPSQLIELQPAYVQRGAAGAAEGTWQPDWAGSRSSKGEYLLRRLAEIAACAGPAQPRPKVIVFSQFWEHMLLLDILLEQQGIRHATFGGDRNMRQRGLREFQHDPACNVLLMDTSGSVGLDLSFASWVFLMEPVADPALLEQVVSRAHRMGASQPVTVETLVMKGAVRPGAPALRTVEEAMVAAPRSVAGRGDGQAAVAAGDRRALVHQLLLSLVPAEEAPPLPAAASVSEAGTGEEEAPPVPAAAAAAEVEESQAAAAAFLPTAAGAPEAADVLTGPLLLAAEASLAVAPRAAAAAGGLAAALRMLPSFARLASKDIPEQGC